MRQESQATAGSCTGAQRKTSVREAISLVVELNSEEDLGVWELIRDLGQGERCKVGAIMSAVRNLASVARMDAVVLSNAVTPAETAIKPRFCSSGCVKCAPVSLALRSDGGSSCVRSECSSSPLSSMGSMGGNSLLTSSVSSRGSKKSRFGSSVGLPLGPMAVLMEEKGSSNGHGVDLRMLRETLRTAIPLLESRGVSMETSFGQLAEAALQFNAADFSLMRDVDLSSADELPALGEEDELWLQMREEARWDSVREPLLASFLNSSILSHRSLERALAFHLGNKLSNSTLLSTQLFTLIIDTFMESADIRRAFREDIKAVKERDPACVSYSHCMLNFKGFLACQAYRVAHRLWNQGRNALALLIQSRVSEVFHVDIHPAAKIGSSILLDHATGLVVGETATIGNNVSILHHVTLGGTGAHGGDRHPKIGDGVLIGAGATILGNIKIGEGAKIGACSVVLIDVPPRTTAVGNPARLVGGKSPSKLKEIPSETMDHTSFIKGWSDYVI